VACTETSRALVGSSAIRRLGPSARDRASEARWRSPPESSCGNLSPYARGRRTASSSSSTRLRAFPGSAAMPWTTRGSATASAMLSSGLKLEAGSWNTKPMFFRTERNSRSRKAFISWPSTWSEPPVTFVRPAIARPIVVFPEPLSPTRPSTSPGETVKLTPSTAVNPPRPNLPGKWTSRSRATTTGSEVVGWRRPRSAAPRRGTAARRRWV